MLTNITDNLKIVLASVNAILRPVIILKEDKDTSKILLLSSKPNPKYNNIVIGTEYGLPREEHATSNQIINIKSNNFKIIRNYGYIRKPILCIALGINL